MCGARAALIIDYLAFRRDDVTFRNFLSLDELLPDVLLLVCPIAIFVGSGGQYPGLSRFCVKQEGELRCDPRSEDLESSAGRSRDLG
jgi:hypothetical protein